MKTLFWRFRFAIAFIDIFSKPKGYFTGNHFMLGWEISLKQKMDISPRQAAINEVTKWYYE
jgi:hypothetical protein